MENILKITPFRGGETAARHRRPLRVALVQRVLAHYRAALFRELDSSDQIDVTYYTCGQDRDGIAHLPASAVKRQRLAPFHSRWRIYWQSGVVKLAFSREFDVLILSGNPHHLSSWLAAALARLRGLPVLFWTHGWRWRETGRNRWVRMAFYRLADRLLIYSERGKRLGSEAGYPAERMTVVYNSLDLGRADAVIKEIEQGARLAPQPASFFTDAGRPLLICSARLTAACRFDLLLRAAALLKEQNRPVNILLVGDGPKRAELEALSTELDLDVHCAGSVYDEERLGTWIYWADATVSPGKVGLTAIHSLMYGTPVITHGDLDAQMPEVETVVEGRTGAYFTKDNESDLARTIAAWLDNHTEREVTRESCRAVTRDVWNPRNQAKLFEEAIAMVCNR